MHIHTYPRPGEAGYVLDEWTGDRSPGPPAARLQGLRDCYHYFYYCYCYCYYIYTKIPIYIYIYIHIMLCYVHIYIYICIHDPADRRLVEVRRLVEALTVIIHIINSNISIIKSVK